eukprot:5168270-Ditylum_brightwellii.AAC.1
MLLEAFIRILEGGDECNIVLVSGLIGAGKRTLVEQTARRYLKSRGGHFLHLKFDVQHQQGGASSALLFVLGVLCKNIIESGEKKKLERLNLKIDLEEAIGAKGM